MLNYAQEKRKICTMNLFLLKFHFSPICLTVININRCSWVQVTSELGKILLLCSSISALALSLTFYLLHVIDLIVIIYVSIFFC